MIPAVKVVGNETGKEAKKEAGVESDTVLMETKNEIEITTMVHTVARNDTLDRECSKKTFQDHCLFFHRLSSQAEPNLRKGVHG